ncbi:MAG: NAD-dependent epimerase/dehydratase family protein [Treponema sp.]|jgi:UDP-glucuronate 4-epimerase|nr:NAD-dependent epimerase/dehydratase family protein [Treponema sp.]
MKILVTGIAGFIGFHLARCLAERGDEVIGLDNLNTYYDVGLKLSRLAELGVPEGGSERVALYRSTRYDTLRFVLMNLEDSGKIQELFAAEHFEVVVNLAAQAGVRYSLTNPDVYLSSNIQGFLSILEGVRKYPVKHLVYASSSSVYGLDRVVPFSETSAADQPASLYAVTKRANELMAHSYSHLYGIPATGLRFFTVYGPWGRPDMAPFLFTKAILEGRPIDVFNYGDMSRDFTYIDDIIDGIIRVLEHIPSWGKPCAGVYNIGNGAPVRLLDFIQALETELGMRAEKNLLPMQPGDVMATWADCTALKDATGYCPQTGIAPGVKQFVTWYRSFYRI